MIRRVARRLLTITAGYFAACIVASIALWLGFLAADMLAQSGAASGARAALGWIFSVGIFFAVTVGVVSLIPAAIFILLSEFKAIRERNFFLLSGVTLGLGFVVMMRYSSTVSGAGSAIGPGFDVANVAVFGVAGGLAGFVYWLLAGRSAGT